MVAKKKTPAAKAKKSKAKAAPKAKQVASVFDVNQAVRVKPGHVYAGFVFQIDIVRTVKGATDYLLRSGAMPRTWMPHNMLEAV